MIVRTGGRAMDAYLCYQRHRDRGRCDQPPVPRAAVDGAVFSYFEGTGLDLHAMLAEFARRADATLAQVSEQLEEAEREEGRAVARLERVRRAFQDEKIEADDWREQRTELEAEREAAAANLARLKEREREVTESRAAVEAEEDVAMRLATIRAAIVGKVRDAEGVDAFRAALMRVFEGFVLRPGGAPQEAELDIGDYCLEPIVCEDAIEELVRREDGREYVLGEVLRPVAIPPPDNYPNVKA